MEEALQPLAAEQQVKTTNYFAVGIAASLTLHLICTLLLVSLPQGPSRSQAVTYIDLGLPQQQAAPIPIPAPQAAAKVAAKPEPAALPEEEEPAEQEQAQPQVKQSQEQPAQPPAAPQKTDAAEEPAHNTLGLGLTKGYFKSLRDGEGLRPVAKEYFLGQILPVINEKWWLDEKLDKKNAGPLVVNIVVARNGEILAADILAQSGNPRYDRAVLAALKAAGPLPPLPANFQGDHFEAMLRLVPPLNLMAW